jgi:hypothetical protein
MSETYETHVRDLHRWLDQALRERDEARKDATGCNKNHQVALEGWQQCRRERDEARKVARRLSILRRSTCNDPGCGPDCQEWQSLTALHPWLIDREGP